MKTLNLAKGVRVQIHYLKADPFGTSSLAGMQPKFTGRFIDTQGVITSIGYVGDHTDPKNIRLTIDCDDGTQIPNCRLAWITDTVGDPIDVAEYTAKGEVTIALEYPPPVAKPTIEEALAKANDRMSNRGTKPCRTCGANPSTWHKMSCYTRDE